MSDQLQQLEAQRQLTDAYRGRLGPGDGHAETVLADLALFCCAAETTAAPLADGRIDPMLMAIGEGRRQVWNRIIGYLSIDYALLGQIIAEHRRQYPQQQ